MANNRINVIGAFIHPYRWDKYTFFKYYIAYLKNSIIFVKEITIKY